MYNKLTLMMMVGCMTVGIVEALPSSAQKTQKKVLIWDLGNTLMRTDTMGFASEIGLRDFLLYPLLDWKNPLHIRELVFRILDCLAEPQVGTITSIATSEGRPLPTVMCNWLSGTQSGTDICLQAQALVEEYDKAGLFISNRQKRLVQRALDAMFDPEKLPRHTYVIKAGLNILRECAEQYDERGNPRYTLYILSNWDPDSFRYLYTSKEFQKILQYVGPENIIISGDIGTIKPYASIYEYFVTKFKVNPQECILIDDQWENIHSAQQSGMHGIHLERNNYRKLRRELRSHRII